MTVAVAPELDIADELFDFDDAEPTNEDIRDPGLYPRFHLFIANFIMGYLRHAPGRINALISAFHTLESNSQTKAVLEAMPFAREVFVDSGAITPLTRCMRGRGTPEELRAWLDRTDDVIDLCQRLHDTGTKAGIVAAMDLPAYERMLTAADLTVAQAHELTLERAVDMLDRDLPPDWKPMFTSQGVTLDEHLRCMNDYEAVGVLDAVRRGDAWLAVGGMAFESKPNRVHVVHRAIRERLGEGHIHALGVTRWRVLVPMIVRGWVDSADSSRPCQIVRYNLHPYKVQGPRPTFLIEAMHTASTLVYEANLAAKLEQAERIPLTEQGELFDGE